MALLDRTESPMYPAFPRNPRTRAALRACTRSCFMVLFACAASAPLVGQVRNAAIDRMQWLDPHEAAPAVPQVAQRLPVLDDAGRPISMEEIEARIDPGGGAGAFWGGLLGLAIATPVLHLIMTNSQDCDESRQGLYIICSPREDAMRSAVTWGGAGLVTTLAAWFGWEADKTDWHEAVRQIREDRRRIVR